MSQDDIGEKTQQPTPKRLREAKEQGNVARSKDLGAWLTIFSSAMGLFIFSNTMGNHAKQLFIRFLSTEYLKFDLTPSKLTDIFLDGLWMAAQILLPLFMIIWLVSIIVPPLITGWIFAMNNVQPKLERLDPIKGIARIFSLNSLFELAKSILKIALTVLIGIILYKIFLADIFRLHHFAITVGIANSLKIIFWSFLILSLGLLIVCFFDVPYQIWQRNQKLQMTMHEVKEEYKETEGKPEVKSKINKLQREYSRRRMLQEIESCDVIITNPTHFAVALKYDNKTMKVPIVVAKGKDMIAQKIIEIANQHKIPLVMAPPLTRSIYYFTEIGDEVPSQLYVAVAKVLAYVYQLKSYKKGKAKKPKFPEKLEIPTEMKR